MHLDPSLIAKAEARAGALMAVHRLFFAVDARRWDALAEVCTPDLSASWPGLDPAQPFPAAVRESLRGVLTHHLCTNACVVSEGASAEVEFLVEARHRRPTTRGGDTLTRLSRDRASLRLVDGTWRVAALSRAVKMVEGNPGILAARTEEVPPAATPPLPPEPPAGTDAERLARLADGQAIHDLMMRFGRGLDAKDWGLYRSCFADAVTVDFAQTTGRTPRRVPADAFVEFVRARQRGHAAFHQYANVQVSVRGDEARALVYLVARHRAPDAEGDPLNVFVGWYDNRFVRTPEGWRIDALSHPLQWVEGNAAIKDAPDPEADAIGARLFG